MFHHLILEFNIFLLEHIHTCGTLGLTFDPRDPLDTHKERSNLMASHASSPKATSIFHIYHTIYPLALSFMNVI